MVDPEDIDCDISLILGVTPQRQERPSPQAHLPHRRRPRSNSSETIRPFCNSPARLSPIAWSEPPAHPHPPLPPRRVASSSPRRLKASCHIHDGEVDLNLAYDYKFISLSDLQSHTIFREIQMELYASARMMGRADSAAWRRRDGRGSTHEHGRRLLLPRHVKSLPFLPSVYGNLRESYVALLALIALKAGIRIVSVDKLRQWPGQTEMYQDIARTLEDEMCAVYEESCS